MYVTITSAVELRLGKIRRRRPQYLVRSPQFTVLTFQRFEPLAIARRHSITTALLPLSLPDPLAQRLRGTPNLRRHRLHRRPLRLMRRLMIKYQPNRPFPYLRGIPICRFHRSILSRNGASGKVGAVQCEHLVIVSPNWWWAAPTLLKGYVDRVFLPGFAMSYHDRFPYVQPLLKGRSARVIYTQNSPRIVGVLFRGDLFWRWISRCVLGHCGFRPVRRLALYGAKDASPGRRAEFVEAARDLGCRAA
jgi:hypothetical protein